MIKDKALAQAIIQRNNLQNTRAEIIGGEAVIITEMSDKEIHEFCNKFGVSACASKNGEWVICNLDQPYNPKVRL